jgi:hypothetical protein
MTGAADDLLRASISYQWSRGKWEAGLRRGKACMVDVPHSPCPQSDTYRACRVLKSISVGARLHADQWVSKRASRGASKGGVPSRKQLPARPGRSLGELPFLLRSRTYINRLPSALLVHEFSHQTLLIVTLSSLYTSSSNLSFHCQV